MFDEKIQIFAAVFLPTLLGIILHEVAHGWVAHRLGDPTARSLGRLTLNPIPHIDPVGLLVFIASSLMGGFVFGWARPVPVNPRFFKNPAKGMMLTALAGPCANLALALLCTLLVGGLLFLNPPAGTITSFAATSLLYGIGTNIGLALFNLLPIPPLDGSKVLVYFLPYNAASAYLSIERYGFIILVLLLLTGVLNTILVPLTYTVMQAFLGLVNLSL